MTETDTTSRDGRSADGRDLGSLMVPELRKLAGGLGIKGVSGMRKQQLVEAVRAHQGGGRPASSSAPRGEAARDDQAPRAERRADKAASSAPAQAAPETGASADQGTGAAAQADTARAGTDRRHDDGETGDRRSGRGDGRRGADQPGEDQRGETDRKDAGQQRDGGRKDAGQQRDGGRQRDGGQQHDGGDDGGNRSRRQRNRGRGDRDSGQQRDGGQQRGGRGRGGDQHDGDSRRSRRVRDRRGRGGGDVDTEIREDDVLQPVAGILDVLDNYAFVRTSGYLPGSDDVYVSMNMVRKNGLRRGDALTGAVRVAREGEGHGKQKFNPLVRLDSVNGGPVEAAKGRPDFNKLTPLYPNERLRLETTPEVLTTRVIDLIMPIGKGQRALIVSPPKAGKTTVLQNIANAIATNNPECYLMVVLVDERPEEVTDMQRSVRGEVIASTFDRPPSDHTSVAELAIERAKRLVEAGQDVVVLLDSITRLGRAYNNSSPASGRILSGGVDSTALYPPKRFLGAARNIENGGSLTILATAMVETGSQGDTVIFEEFKGTGNAELKLDRKIAERRVFPAVDINPSGTRRDDLLLAPEEFAVVHKLRRVMSGLDSHQAIDVLMEQLKKTRTNYEFLMQVSKTAPGAD